VTREFLAFLESTRFDDLPHLGTDFSEGAQYEYGRRVFMNPYALTAPYDELVQRMEALAVR